MAKSPNEIKVSIIGGENTGKTMFIQYLQNNTIEGLHFSDYIATNGASNSSKNINSAMNQIGIYYNYL